MKKKKRFSQNFQVTTVVDVDMPDVSGLAAAIAKGEAPVGQCPVGGAPVAAKIAAIMGEEAGESVHEVAFVNDAGTCEKQNRHMIIQELQIARWQP